MGYFEVHDEKQPNEETCNMFILVQQAAVWVLR